MFATFVNSIVGQQISVIAAEAIWNRLKEKVGEITPENIASFSPEEIAACGLTKSKTSYILGIANNPEEFLNQNYSEMTDEEIHKHFITFRGIGPWTSEMLMIFFTEAKRVQHRRYWSCKSGQNSQSKNPN